jgi:hypothetical protein
MRESSKDDQSKALLGDIAIVINLISKYNLAHIQVLDWLSEELKEISFWKKRIIT